MGTVAITGTVSEWKVGDTFSQRLVEDLTRTQIVQYAGASGDYNPLHTDEVYATKVARFPSVFAHGMLTMGMAGSLLTDRFGLGALTRYGVRFTAQVWPGDTLDATATVTAVAEDEEGTIVNVDLVVKNQDEVEVLRGDGQARLRRPDPTRDVETR